MEITVQGEAQAAFPPERATVHIMLGFEGPSKEQALAQTTELVGRFSAAVMELRSGEQAPVTWSAVDAIGTRSWRPYSQSGQVMPLRYAASCRTKTKFRDFVALSRFIDQWGGRDGVTVNFVEWALTEQARIREEERVLVRAVEAARLRAQTMATAAGAGTVRFLQLADPGLLTEGRPEVADMALTARAMAPGSPFGGGGEGINLQPEDVELFAQVQARFSANS